MKMDLKNAVVVITGASSGIGEATALAFARQGSRLVIAARDLDALEAVAEDCRRMGGQAIAVEADVTDPAAVKRLAEQAMTWGKIDIWVSNVGVGAVGRFQDTPIDAHEQIIRANLIGHMNDAHAVLPIFLQQGHGIFVNMISLGGFAAAPFAAAYSASKFGLRGFSEALRAELADRPDIHICDIYPAFVDTPGIGHGANYVGRKLSAPPPLVDPRDVADAIVAVTQRPRATTTVGSVTNAARLAHLLAPNLSTRILGRFMASYFRRANRVAQSSGNVFSPPSVPGGIDGGMRSPNGNASHPLMFAMLAIAAMAGGAAVARIARRRR
jgi:short-subunit dehydrogenase